MERYLNNDLWTMNEKGRRFSPPSFLFISLHDHRLHRLDRRQEVCQQVPAIAGIPAVKQLTRIRADIDARLFERIGRHRLAQHDQVGFIRQALRHSLPGITGIPAAPNREFTIHAHAEFVAFLQRDVHCARVGGVDGDREAEARRQFAFADVDPVFAGIVTAIDTAMVLLIDQVGVRGVHHHFMDTLPEFGEFVRHEISAHIPVAGAPGLPTVVGAVAARGGDRDIHPLGIRGIQKDGVQAQASGAGIPLAALRMIVQGFVDLPGLAAVLRDEQGGGLRAGIQHIGLTRAPGLDVPNLDHLFGLRFDAFAAFRAERFLHRAGGSSGPRRAGEDGHLPGLRPGLAEVI